MDILTTFPKPHPQTSGRVIDGEAILILADSSEINVLNGVGSSIYALCTGEHSVADIIAAIVAEYDVAQADAQSDTLTFLTEMIAQNVLITHTQN